MDTILYQWVGILFVLYMLSKAIMGHDLCIDGIVRPCTKVWLALVWTILVLATPIGYVFFGDAVVVFFTLSLLFVLISSACHACCVG